MSAQALVRELNENGVYPFLQDGRLKTRSQSGAVAPALADKIRAHKEALIAFLDGGGAGAGQPAAIAPVPDDGTPVPLSFAQRRLWFIDQLQGGGSQYNIATALELRGAADLDAIDWALNEVVQRHAVLRSTYASHDGEPAQQVRARALRLRRVDLRGVADDERESRLRDAAIEERMRPFDLGADLMLRACVFIAAEARCVVVITLHHIACDGWSKGVLTREFVALYGARVGGGTAALAPLPVQYADYARWQAAPGFAARMASQVAYWERQLADIPQLHGLRLDRPRPAQQPSSAGCHLRQLDGALLARLKRLALAHDATLFMLLHSAFALLVARLSQENTVVIGSPVAGRQRRELEPLIGFFVNMLVLRTGIDGALPFTDLLAQGRADALAAYANQDVPFEMLVEKLQPRRDLSHSPLFQIMFALQNNDYGTLALPGVELGAFAAGEESVGRFDLELLAGEREDGLTLHWVFADALFDPATIHAMAASFEVLLKGICDDPACAVGDLPLLTDDDRGRLNAWRAARAGQPVPAEAIHQMFEREAALRGGAVALVHDGLRLTYAQLNARANRLAHALIARGVGRDQLVGICLARSAEMVAAVLAVLKAGGAYVALDPSYPDARLRQILDDSAVSVVLTARDCAWREPQARGLAMYVDRIGDGGGDGDAAAAVRSDPALPVDPEQLAYAIYTSGSTGKPKGIVLPHRVLSNLVGSQYRRYPALAQPSPALQFATLNFDMSIYEIMTALCNGGTLVLPSDEARTSLSQLGALLRAERIGRLYLPTSMLPEFCQYAVRQSLALPDLRVVQVAGEALTINADVRAFFRATPGCTLLNLYGPSESHVVTDLELAGDPDLWPVAPAIGHPIDNSALFVLDARRNEVPVGVAGELFIGGACLARGYLDQPALTAEKFLEPAAGGHRPRLYRSGDLVRHGADGALEYLGRIGRQVKLRGFRIELDDIEHCLLADDRVADAVVLATGEGADKSLAAYIMPRGAFDDALADAVRADLAARVPDYMVPATLVALERFPLNANGKVDVARLPAPHRQARGAYVAPAPGMEQRMACLWAELLRKPVEEIGAHAGFFELGGHSLLAMRLVNRIEQAFGARPAVRTIFAKPGLSELCAELATLGGGACAPLRRADGDGPRPLSYSQQRLWYIDQLEGGSGQYHLPTALRLRGAFDPAALQAAVDAVVARHAVLRTVYVNDDGNPAQRVLPARPVAIGFIAMAAAADEPALVARLRAEVERPFDLGRDPVLRVQLLALAPDDHVLLVTLHHIAADGWSIGVLARELSALYGAHAAGQPAALAPLALQYGDFAAWQRDPSHGVQLERQLEYWRGQLAGLAPVHGLPLDRARPALADYRGALHTQRLDAALTARAAAVAQEGGATLFMCLQAAFATLLMRWSNAEEFAIGSPVAGRTRAELDGLIGLFVNTLVLRHTLADGATFRQQMAATKRLALDAFANQEVPFEMLVEALRPARSLGHAPLFQVSFILQNNEQVELTLPGVHIEGVALGTAQAKFDLSLTVRETDGELLLQWTYATGLFDGATVARLAQSFETLLRAALADPDRALLALPLAPAADLALLQTVNATRDAGVPRQCVHEMIGATARRLPLAVAVRDERGQYDYRQLDQASDAVARMLAARGIGAGARVALCMDPSVELMAALLGVLKSGAAYLPLELNNTPARMHAILADAGVAALLQVRGLAAPLLAHGPADGAAPVPPCLGLDGCCAPGWGAQWADTPLPAAPGPDAGAYLIYTSGTSGVPKGVDVHHGGLTDYCVFASRHYYDAGLSGALVVTSHGFDITVPSLYLPLLNGGCVTLPPRSDILQRVAAELAAPAGPDYLLRMTPMHAQGVLALLADGAPSAARHVFVIGGERFAPALARALQRRFPASTIHNHYGPSETVVGCCMYNVTANAGGPADGGAELPIGAPMANTCLHVLNAAMQPVPLGVPGELYIGGAGVSRGYLNRPELTRRHFVDNPFGPDWAPRLYRSGDLVRFDGAGCLYHLGRLDEQIKLRGFRIEPAEIEARIGAVAGVRKAVVVAAGEGAQRHLAAYIEAPARRDAGFDPQALIEQVRLALREALPDYLVPSSYVCLERLPLSANGKLDKRALPPVAPAAAGPVAAPATPTELALCQLWAGLLGVDAGAVGADAGFFELGGHSLLAVMLVAAVRRRFGVALPLGSLYTAPDVRAQAALIDAAGPGPGPEPGRGLVLLQPGAGAPLFLVHPVGGDVLCYRALVRELAYGGPVYGIEHAALGDGAPVAYRGVEQLAEDYCARLRQVQPHGPYRLAGWSLGGVIALALAHRLERAGETVAYLGLVDSVLEHAQQPWQTLQARVADVTDLAAWQALLEQDADLAARFDRAYGLDALAAAGEHALRARLRAVTLAGVVAGRLCRAGQPVRALHYYGADATARQTGEAAAGRLLALAREGASATWFDTDHFGLLRAPLVSDLARRMREHLRAAPATLSQDNQGVTTGSGAATFEGAP
jgi:amino acid adenylation domain-containing protein